MVTERLYALFDNSDGVLRALVEGVSHLSAEGIKQSTKWFADLAREMGFVTGYLREKSASSEAVGLMFQAMVDIWDKTDTDNPLERYKLAAPVYSVSLITKGYNLHRSELIGNIADELALRAGFLEKGHTLTVLDIGSGVGMQGQVLARKLIDKDIRDKVEIVGIGPIQEELDVAAERKIDGQPVYDALVKGKASDFSQVCGDVSRVDVLMSTGVFGSYVDASEFSAMLSHPAFTDETAYMFATRAKASGAFLKVLEELHLQGTIPTTVDVKGGYDMPLLDSAGNMMNRDYAFHRVNAETVRLEQKLSIGSKGGLEIS